MNMSATTVPPASISPRPALGLRHLDHLNLSVNDLAETEDFYARVFGFEVVERAICDDGTPMSILRAGDAMLCAYEHADWEFVANTDRRTRRLHGINHFALRITDRAAFEATIKREKVELNWGGAAIEYPHSTSFYVQDPTGYGIEVVLWNEDTVAF